MGPLGAGSGGALPAAGSGAVGSIAPVASAPKFRHKSERRRALRRAGVAASTTELVMLLPGQQPRSATPATRQTLAPGAFSRGETEARMGKATCRLGRVGTGHGSLRPCCCAWRFHPCGGAPRGAPPGAAGVRQGTVGAVHCPGGPRCFGRGSVPRGHGHGPRLGRPWRPLALGSAGGGPKPWGARGGAWPRAGGSGKAPSHRLPARAMTHAGQGELGEEAAASWARRRLQRRPREPSGMRWHSSRFPRRPWCRKYTRSWWRLPQRWAGCHAVEGGTTPDPGVPARDPGAGRWELRGVVEPGAGRDQRLLPRLPLPPPAFDVPGLRPW